MQLTINGQLKHIENIDHLDALVKSFCPQMKNIITEVNGQIVYQDAWPTTPLHEGDVIEMVTFVGGG